MSVGEWGGDDSGKRTSGDNRYYALFYFAADVINTSIRGKKKWAAEHP